MTTQISLSRMSVVLCALLAIPSVSSAQPLTIHGVHPEMKYEAVISTLKQRSMHCDGFEEWQSSSTGERFQTVKCSSMNTPSNDHPDISVTANDRGRLVNVMFECSATRTCGLDEEQVIEALVDANVLPDGTAGDHNFPGYFNYTDENGNTVTIDTGSIDPKDRRIWLKVNEESLREFDF